MQDFARLYRNAVKAEQRRAQRRQYIGMLVICALFIAAFSYAARDDYRIKQVEATANAHSEIIGQWQAAEDAAYCAANPGAEVCHD